MPQKLFHNITKLCGYVTSEPILPKGRDSFVNDDWFQNESSPDFKCDDFTDRMGKDEKREFREKIVNELKKDMTYEKIRERYIQMHSKSIVYDPMRYGQFAIDAGIIHSRLVDIYGDDVIYLQDPKYSQKCLDLYKKWKSHQEEIREGQRLMKAQEVDQRGMLSMLREKEKAKIEKLARFKHLISETSSADTKSTITSLKGEKHFLTPKPDEKHDLLKFRSQTTIKKYTVKYGDLSVETDQSFIERINDTDIKKIYENVEALRNQEKTFFPKQYFTLRRKKKGDLTVEKPVVEEERKSNRFSSSSIGQKILKTFKTAERRESNVSEFHDFSDDIFDSSSFKD